MQSDRELDEVEQLINAALPGYSEVEPRSGLNLRVLAYARAQRTTRRRLLSRWTLAIPAVASLLLFLLLRVDRRPLPMPREVTAPAAPANIPGSPAVVASVDLSSLARTSTLHLHQPPRPLSSAIEALPKRDVFPTPSPLTAEERALVALNRVPVQMPRRVQDATAEIDPIHIAELQIKPLAVKTFNIPDSVQSTQ